MKKLLTGRLANVQTKQDWDLWQSFRKAYRTRGSNRNEALTEAIELWNEQNHDFKPVPVDNRLINSTSMIIMKTWNKFKELFKKRGMKKDPAISEAIELYIDKYRSER